MCGMAGGSRPHQVPQLWTVVRTDDHDCPTSPQICTRTANGAGTTIDVRNALPIGTVQSFVRTPDPRETRGCRISPTPANHGVPADFTGSGPLPRAVPGGAMPVGHVADRECNFFRFRVAHTVRLRPHVPFPPERRQSAHRVSGTFSIALVACHRQSHATARASRRRSHRGWRQRFPRNSSTVCAAR